ncbi:MAG: methionyl-tRNA formyltransferase [Candidatus Saccharimonadales bacterium]
MRPIVFFGSGPVAAKSLELLASDFKILAVITKPKPAHHHGSFPVIDIATQLNLSIYTASNKQDLAILFRNEIFPSDLAVLIDFGIIVGQDVIDYFPKGIVNSHFSLLPEWRGADPITFAILSGQKQTGVSLMLLVKAMDEGPLLAQATYDIPEDVTATSLTDDLIELSYKSLQTILPMYSGNEIQPGEQLDVSIKPNQGISYSRKLTKQDGVLDFNKSAFLLEREIRAFIEWPKSKTKLAGKEVIVTKAHSVASANPHASIGDIDVVKDTGVLSIKCADGSLCVDMIKPAGKNEMTIKAFLAGYGQHL